jgi:signal transduction histidine kinase
MKFRTWPLAAAALAALLLLIVLSVLAASRKAQDIYAQLDALNTHHRTVEGKLRRLRSDVHLSGIFVRDYLLDTARENASEYRERLADLRRANMATVDDLRALVRPEDRIRVDGLREDVDEYWRTFDPLFDWTPFEKFVRSAGFLRRDVLPRRERVLALAQEIEELNNVNLATERAEVTRRQDAFKADLYRLLWQVLLLGLALAVIAVSRLRILEQRSDDQRARAARAEHQMRELSQQLVATQEDERKKLSRELHDHVGQMLTALRMELSLVERVWTSPDTRVALSLAECKQLVETMLRTVRDLALGLRPSMLDDFGLRPALEWHVRDFRRRFNITVETILEGDLDTLPDRYRTCVYRVVQEALTNCVRHAGASRIEVVVRRTAVGVGTHPAARLEVSINDDGIGLDGRHSAGLGLIGIEERVRELHGTVSIRSAVDAGTRLTITLPLPANLEELTVARAAG